MAIGMSGKAQFGFKLVFYEPIQSDVSGRSGSEILSYWISIPLEMPCKIP